MIQFQREMMIYISSHNKVIGDSLAFEFYGNSDLWWFVARVNNLKTMNIPAGTSLRIPTTLNNAKGF